VSNITATSADFTWTAGYLGNVGVYNFEYGPSNYTQGTTAGSTSVVNASTTIAANPNSLFVGGTNATWSYIQNLVISSDGVTSQAAQTYTINVTSLPTTGAKARLIKSDAGNNAVFTPAAVGQDLVLGPNTFTASAVAFNRYVKIQFNNNAFEFDAISVNGTLVYNGANTTLTALTAETGYDVYVQADCGSVGTSAWVGPISFTTSCIPVAAPYIENFDGATFPDCWSQATSDNGDWILNTGGTVSGSTGPSDDMTVGGNYMYIETTPGSSGNTFELITPTIDLSALSSPQLRFYSHMYGATVGSLKVDVTNDNGATYTNVFTKSGDQGNQWNEELVVINLTGNVSFKITGIRGSSYTGDIAIDNFEVREGPSCNTPNSLSASNLTATSADFTWTAGGTESVFNFEYGPSNYTLGSTAGTSSVVNAITTIAANPNSLFVGGTNATWSYIQNLVISSDGVTSQAAQTYTINVTSLPTTGAKARLIKSDAGNNAVFTPAAVGQDLVLGPNTFTASAVNFDRYVKIQFNNNAFEFDNISVNGTSVYNGYSTSITSFIAETDYDVYVQADCGSSLTSAWVGPFSFTTICSPVANITENFDAATAIPNCFGTVVVGTSNTGVVLNAPPTGNNSIYLKKYQSPETAILLLPPVSTLGNDYRLKFSVYNASASGSGVMDVGTVDANDNFTSFQQITINSNRVWETQRIDFSSYTGSDVRVAITGLYNATASASFLLSQTLIDNVVWEQNPSCFEPYAIVANNLTATSADVSWTAGGTETAYNFEYGPSNYTLGSTAGTSSVVQSSTNTSITGLTANTSYDVYVQSDCGFGTSSTDVSTWEGPFSFTTFVGPHVLPLSEDFESGFSNFDNASSNGTDWSLSTSFFHSGLNSAHNGHGSSNNNILHETGILDLSATTVPQIEFWHIAKTEGTYDKCYVEISTDGGQTYTALPDSLYQGTASQYGTRGYFHEDSYSDWGTTNAPNLDNVTSWKYEKFLLTSYRVPNVRLRFRLSSDGSANRQGWYIDDILIEEPCPIYATTETVVACDSYTWPANGTTYGPGLSGIKTEILQSVDGCDSTVTLDLTITESNSSSETVTACDSLQWNGSTYFTSGNQTFTTTNAAGCDSVVNLQLSINNSTSSLLVPPSQCSSYDWNGTTYTSSGIYVNTSVNSIGCNQYDSLDLTVINATSFTETPVTTCDSYDWNGTNYTSSGIYTYTTTNSVGCDSTVTLDLTITNSSSFTETVTACDSLQWNGSTYFTTGNQTFTTTNAASCDSVVNLVLTINNSSSSLLATSSCNSYLWNGTTYSSSGVYENISVNSDGCTQTDTLDLTITTSSTSLTQSSCDSFSWNGTDYTTSGTYYSASGTCVDTLFLTVNSSTSSVNNLASCDSLEWNGLNYLTSGTYTYTTTNSVGCDSTATLNLTINNSETNTTDTLVTACDSYDWNGTTYTSSGTQLFTATNVAGCDSVLKLILTINNSSSSLLATSSCDSYDWNGTTYSTSGIYVDTLVNSSGCPQIDTLDLTITNSTSSVTNEVACDSLSWNGLNYLTSGTYTYITTNSNGCDSTATLNLTINNSESNSFPLTVCDHYIWNGDTLTSSGVYVDTLQNTNSCDSIVSVDLTVINSSIDTLNAFSCEDYIWNGNTYSSSGNYTDTLTSSVTGCDSIVTLSLTINLDSAPYFEDFAGGLPICWTNNTTDVLDWSVNSGGTPSGNTGPSDDVSGGGNYIYMETSGSSAGDSAMLTTGNIDLSSLTSPGLRLYSHMFGGSIGELSVWVTDASGTMTQVFLKIGDQGDQWVVEYIDLASFSGTVNFTILGVNSSTATGVAFQGDIAIDNFEVMELPSCIDPYGLTVSNLLGTSAEISWTSPSSTVTSWSYVYDTAGFDPLTATPVSIASDSVSLSGLNTSTSYDFYVQSDCGSNVGTWIGPLNFTTMPGPGTCGFFTVDLFDSFGDGWNGNGLIVSVNGVVYDTLTIASGATATYLIPSDIGDVLDFNYVIDAYATGGNTWVSENSYTVTNSSGIVVANETYDGTTVPSTLGMTACPPNDLAAYAAIVPSGCDLSATESLEFWVVNTGTVAESAFDVAYVANGGTQVIESITSTLNPSDTLKHVFATTVDMSADGLYTVDFVVILSTDSDSSNNTVSVDAENYLTPSAPTTMGDSICDGDTAMVSADADYAYWYDAATGGNLVGEGDELDISPSVTTSYYAESAVVKSHSEDFDSLTVGDFIVASDPNNWAVWPGGGAAADMPITDVQGNGGNSLRVFNSDGTDIVLEFGEAFSSGKFYYSMDMYMVGDGYINFQEDVAIGTTWNMSITFIGGVMDIEIDGASVLTGSYTSTDPAGNTVWNTFEFECDYSTGTWEVFADGVSQGTFVNADPVASVNIYPGAGVEYYLDNVEWYALTDDACRSTSRTEAVVTVEDCSNTNIIDLSFEDLRIYPNPNNGLFTITNSQEMTDVVITDLQGKIVYNSRNINLNKINVELNNLQRGMYLINIKTENDI
ncbi:T9SS type A sorting domain-containing protein, partial [bacterium]|nr:T9SS type A sorting domain-containing protein [bacterium]